MGKKRQKTYTKVVGTPTMMMLPARNYKFQVEDSDYVITVPRKGKYVDLAPEIYTEEDGEFEIFARQDDDDLEAVLYVPSLTKVLFGVSRYPDLNDNQGFTPIAIVVKKDEVDIVGNIIEMLGDE